MWLSSLKHRQRPFFSPVILQLTFVGKEDIFLYFLGSSGWSNNKVDMRQINRRKSDKSLPTSMHGKDPGKQTLSNDQSPYLKYHFSLETKEDAQCSCLGLQRRERKFPQRWKSRCLVNKCLLGHSETMGHREELE